MSEQTPRSASFPWSKNVLGLYLINMIGFWAVGWYRVYTGGPHEAGWVWFLAGWGWLVHYSLLKRQPYVAVLEDRLIIARGFSLGRRSLLRGDLCSVRLNRHSVAVETVAGEKILVILPFIRRDRREEAGSVLIELIRLTKDRGEKGAKHRLSDEEKLQLQVARFFQSIAGVDQVSIRPHRLGVKWMQHECGDQERITEASLFDVLLSIANKGEVQLSAVAGDQMTEPRTISILRIGEYAPIVVRGVSAHPSLTREISAPAGYLTDGLDVGREGEFCQLGGFKCYEFDEVVGRYDEIAAVIARWPRCGESEEWPNEAADFEACVDITSRTGWLESYGGGSSGAPPPRVSRGRR